MTESPRLELSLLCGFLFFCFLFVLLTQFEIIGRVEVWRNEHGQKLALEALTP